MPMVKDIYAHDTDKVLVWLHDGFLKLDFFTNSESEMVSIITACGLMRTVTVTVAVGCFKCCDVVSSYPML